MIQGGSKELDYDTSLGALGCMQAAHADAECVTSRVVSFGKAGGAHEGKCLCDTNPDCKTETSITDGGYGDDGYSRMVCERPRCNAEVDVVFVVDQTPSVVGDFNTAYASAALALNAVDSLSGGGRW